MRPREYKAACPCGSGKRYKSCCFPKERARADVLDSARRAHARVDEANRVLLPLVHETGHTIACVRGCNRCCVSVVRATRGDALLISGWLREPEQAERRARFELALARWRSAIGAEVEELERILARHGGAPKPDAGPEHERYAELVDTAEFCGPTAPRGPTLVRHAMLTDAIDAGRADMSWAARRAGTDVRERILAGAVLDALG